MQGEFSVFQYDILRSRNYELRSTTLEAQSRNPRTRSQNSKQKVENTESLNSQSKCAFWKMGKIRSEVSNMSTVVPWREWALPGGPVSKTTVASLVSGLVYLHLNTARVSFLYRTVSLSLPSPLLAALDKSKLELEYAGTNKTSHRRRRQTF